MTQVSTPQPVMSLHDEPLWESIKRKEMTLQRCAQCSEWRYPPGPVCPNCLSAESSWEPISGRGEILSWVVFHRTYLSAYPAPYNVIAVQLEEGPIFVSNLEGDAPIGTWIGHKVEMTYETMPDGFILPRFILSNTEAS